jgi:hypothetical protein
MDLDTTQLGARLNGSNGWDRHGEQAASYSHIGFTYTTWKPDFSVCYAEKGLVVSSRIDHEESVPPHNYCILMLWFNDRGALIQGDVHLSLSPDQHVHCETVTGASAEEVAEDLRKALVSQLEHYEAQRPALANYPNVVHHAILNISLCVDVPELVGER